MLKTIFLFSETSEVLGADMSLDVIVESDDAKQNDQTATSDIEQANEKPFVKEGVSPTPLTESDSHEISKPEPFAVAVEIEAKSEQVDEPKTLDKRVRL